MHISSLAMKPNKSLMEQACAVDLNEQPMEIACAMQEDF
jgi:hypothetical protein